MEGRVNLNHHVRRNLGAPVPLAGDEKKVGLSPASRPRLPTRITLFTLPVRDQNTWVELARTRSATAGLPKGTNSGTHPGGGPAARLKAEAHLCTAAYLRPHYGAGGFRTAAQVPA